MASLGHVRYWKEQSQEFWWALPYLGWPNSSKIWPHPCLENSRIFEVKPWKTLDLFYSSTLDLSITFLENVVPILDLKFEDFRELPLKNPWIFWLFNPWLDYDLPWNHCPVLALKFKDFQGVSLKNTWIFQQFNPWLVSGIPWNTALILEVKSKIFQGFSRNPRKPWYFVFIF